MLINYEIDTKFAFLPHLVQRLSPKLLSDIGPNIEAAILDFQQQVDRVVHIGCVGWVIDSISCGLQPFIAGQMQK